MVALTQTHLEGSERRVAPRIRTLKRAKVIFNNGFSTIDCIVRNISATGALLTVDEAVHLPKEFEIRIGEERESRPARLVYRRGMLAGMRFLDVEDEEDGSPIGPSLIRAAAPEILPEDSVIMSAAGEAGLIRRIVPEPLPRAVTARFSWL